MKPTKFARFNKVAHRGRVGVIQQHGIKFFQGKEKYKVLFEGDTVAVWKFGFELNSHGE